MKTSFGPKCNVIIVRIAALIYISIFIDLYMKLGFWGAGFKSLYSGITDSPVTQPRAAFSIAASLFCSYKSVQYLHVSLSHSTFVFKIVGTGIVN